VHVQNLPRDSAFARKVRGDAAYWDETPEMLAQVLEAIERQSFYFRKANFEDAGQPPEPLPRPGQERPQPKTVSLSEWASTL
jgi:hypothetical protein